MTFPQQSAQNREQLNSQLLEASSGEADAAARLAGSLRAERMRVMAELKATGADRNTVSSAVANRLVAICQASGQSDTVKSLAMGMEWQDPIYAPHNGELPELAKGAHTPVVPDRTTQGTTAITITVEGQPTAIRVFQAAARSVLGSLTQAEGWPQDAAVAALHITLEEINADLKGDDQTP